MLPGLSYDTMLRIHKALHSDADTAQGAKIHHAYSPSKMYHSVTLPDRSGREFMFITQNMRKLSSKHTQRVLEATRRGENLWITWIVATDAHGYYGKIESLVTRTEQTVFIEDFIENKAMYQLAFKKRSA